MRYSYAKNIYCPVCKEKMILDDIDYNFKGNQDEYFICETDNCMTSAFVKVRYGKVCKTEFTNSDGKTIKG